MLSFLFFSRTAERCIHSFPKKRRKGTKNFAHMQILKACSAKKIVFCTRALTYVPKKFAYLRKKLYFCWQTTTLGISASRIRQSWRIGNAAFSSSYYRQMPFAAQSIVHCSGYYPATSSIASKFYLDTTLPSILCRLFQHQMLVFFVPCSEHQLGVFSSFR